MKHFAFAVVMLAWAGSATAQPTVEAVYAVESAYAAALTLAIEYAALPRCGSATAVGGCSESAVVERLRIVDAVATSALRGAQLLARDSGAAPQTSEGAVRVAREAVGVFDALVRSVKK
ncbi:MAG TPA: hypothetical protein VFX67_00890 [Burkholderiales bacterium]|nr:hypothetical protein [Burkholderiales bacterium]